MQHCTNSKIPWATPIRIPVIQKFLRFGACLIALLVLLPALHAQTSAQLSGTVTDNTGAIIPGATVSIVNEASKDTRVVVTNDSGIFSFSALSPATYTLQVTAKGFQSSNLTGIELHGGDQRSVPPLALAAGAETQTVTVEATGEMLPVDNGQRQAVLSSKDIDNLALEGRDTTELLKILPGATTVSGGLTNNSPAFSDLNVSANESSIGGGINLNGAPNRGGTALLSDGVSVLDPGDNAGSLGIISPEMTQEVSVQASNFGAYQQNGPVVVSAISKSGGANYHGEGYFDARNDVLNANDWYDNHTGNPKGGAHYYYPGGNIGGPVPFTHKKAFIWGGYERFLQNQGNANSLSSNVPTPEMLAGDFTNDNADNQALCPASATNPTGFSATITGRFCNDPTGSVMPDGYVLPDGHVPTRYLDPGAAALASFWPKANANEANTGGYNYFLPIDNTNNGWLYRLRADYNFNDSNKFFIAYQQAYTGELSQGNGAHIYWTPGNSIPYPGGGLSAKVFTKQISGHFVHVFNPTTTNEFIAAWGFGSFPQGPGDTKAALKTTLGYTYGSVYNQSGFIPSYSSAGQYTFPDFSQGDWFEPNGFYLVRKEVPSFTDNFSKVWGKHTVKVGGYTQNTNNLQANDGTNLAGSIGSFSGKSPNIFTGINTGSPNNPVVNFIIGNVTSYSESNSSPVSNMAYQNTAFYVDDSWKVSKRLSVELGVRFEHVGHWYDRGGTGMAAFFPDRVFSDYNSGKIDPGFYWHAIDPSVPLSGQPNRLAVASPRFGVSYDALGTGNTIVRGGWGAYRFAGQYNDYASALTTAQAVSNYNLPGQKSVLLSQIGMLAPANCTTPPCGVSGSQTGLDANDYGVPITYAYNLTIDQRLKWNMLLDVAYVGNSSSEIIDNGETIQGSGFTGIADQNKTPIGAYFKPDPKTGVISTNPENLATNPNGLLGTPTGNSAADYRPYGYAYGTAGVYKDESNQYSNYNGLQIELLKQTGRLTYNFNFTWSKTLGTVLQCDPFNVRSCNYGVAPIDRPFVFNSSYQYQSGRLHTQNKLLNGALGGWTVSGISTWQAGGSLLAQLGNNVPNFGLTETYTTTSIPGGGSAANGIATGIGTATYYGTDAALAIRPVLTCNPATGLAKYQRLRLQCFSAPAIGQQGGQAYPYLSNASFFDNDLALYKSFPVKEHQSVQFRISAFDWLNHPLPQFSSATQVQPYYNVDYNSKAITPSSQTSSTFGFLDQKTHAPYQRIIELNVKYVF